MLKMAGTFFSVATTVLLGVALAHAQSPQAIIRQAVDTERAGNRSDHTNWIYLEQINKPKDNVRQWVAATQQGNVDRVFQKNDHKLPESQQRELVAKFMHDPRAKKKQIEESDHDNKQIDDLLKLLPDAFRWTQTGLTSTDVLLHFEPNPDFHPPTREARVFGGMTGDVAIDRRQHRIASINGLLTRDVTFGGGILGRLKKGSTFSLQQVDVGKASWQLTAIHVHLEGKALLFKSVSMQEDDQRTQFEQEPSDISLGAAATLALRQPD